MPKLPKLVRDLRYQLFYKLLLKRGFELVTLGDPGCGLQWTICPTGLNAQSIVYSGGLGSDVSFEHALTRRTGCSIVMFDPSPAGVRTMALPENRIPQFRFFPVALAGHSGKLKMAPPKPGEDSWRLPCGDDEALEVTCTDLESLMNQNNDRQIDLLKIDIEGCEYEVIDHLLARRIPVRQICVEYHHGVLPGIRRSQTIRSMLKLVSKGYRLVCQDGANHTFILCR